MMMKRAFPFLLLALLATSCAVYAPKTAVVPLLEQQGDLQVGAALDASTGIALTAAVAATDHIGLQLSGDVGFPSENDLVKFNLRPAVGYFWPLAEGRVSIGLYGGADLARNVCQFTHNLGSTPTCDRYDIHSTTLFGQFDVVWAPAPWVDIAYRLSCGNLHYDRTITALPVEELPADPPQRTVGNSFLVENTLQLRLGGPRLKALISASLAQIPHLPQEENLYYRPLTFGLGLSYQFK